MAGTPKSISMIKQILHLQGLGYGIKTISRELGIKTRCSPNAYTCFNYFLEN